MRRLYELYCDPCDYTFELRLPEPPTQAWVCPRCENHTARRVYTAPMINNPIGGTDFLNAAVRGEAEVPGWSKGKQMRVASAMAAEQRKHRNDRAPAAGKKRSYPGGGSVSQVLGD